MDNGTVGIFDVLILFLRINQHNHKYGGADQKCAQNSALISFAGCIIARSSILNPAQHILGDLLYSVTY